MFAINLITLKLFCILCYFLQQVCSVVFSKHCTLIIGIFVLPTLNYTYCFIIHKAKDAKVSFKN